MWYFVPTFYFIISQILFFLLFCIYKFNFNVVFMLIEWYPHTLYSVYTIKKKKNLIGSFLIRANRNGWDNKEKGNHKILN